jgi:DNA (cytosine-5)-methyltransferase 1
VSVDARPFNVLSMCSGAGGLDLGIGLAIPMARTVCYVEIDAYACELLATRMEEECLDAAPIWSNLRTFDGAAWRGLVDLVIGGYPCQPFSVAGKQLGEKDPRHLWPDVARIVRECDPEWCFFENVGGHLRLGFREVAGKLHSMGYRVAAGLFTAEEIGAPHKRERLFIMAHRCGERRQQVAGSALSDEATNGRTGWHGSEQNSHHQPERKGEGMADASSARRGGSFTIAEGETRNEARVLVSCAECNTMAYPLGRQQARWSGGCNGASGAGPHDQSAGPGADVADTESGERRLQLRQREPGDASVESGGCWEVLDSRRWPPGPADLDAWQAILECWPEVEPALCGMVDGMASRLDRLRLTGNGVVPDVAALAFRTLYRELCGG